MADLYNPSGTHAGMGDALIALYGKMRGAVQYPNPPLYDSGVTRQMPDTRYSGGGAGGGGGGGWGDSTPAPIPSPAAVPSRPDPLMFTPPANAKPMALSPLLDANGDAIVGTVPTPKMQAQVPAVAQYPQTRGVMQQRNGPFRQMLSNMSARRQRRKQYYKQHGTPYQRFKKEAKAGGLDPFRRYPGLVGNAVPQQTVQREPVRDFIRELRQRRSYLRDM